MVQSSFDMPSRTSADASVTLGKVGAGVGTGLGEGVGTSDGTGVGNLVGVYVDGAGVGTSDGAGLGAEVVGAGDSQIFL